MRRAVLIAIFGFMFILDSCATRPGSAATGPLAGLTITLDPGHGHTRAYDNFRAGPTGEREEWINLRVAKDLQKLLLKAGAKVILTRTKDEDVNLGGRASIAIVNNSDLFISIHHNGSTNDTTLDYPLVYVWGAARHNPASVDLAAAVLNGVRKKLSFETPGGAGVYSDFLIYSEGTAVLRNAYPVLPGIIGEMGFFTNARGEARLKDKRSNELEAQGYLNGIVVYARKGIPKALPLKPLGGEYLSPESPDIIFQLGDGLGGQAFDPHSLMVTVDGDIVPHAWDRATGRLTVGPVHFSNETVKVQVFGRNQKGNALHPREWNFLTLSGKAARWKGSWYVAFQRGDSLRVLLNPSSQNFAAQVDSTIYWYQRALILQPVNPKAAETEYRLGQIFAMTRDWRPDESARRTAIHYFERVIAYYPSSEFVKSAREEKAALESMF